MKDFIRSFLFYLNVATLVPVLIIGLTGIIDEIFGPTGYEKFLLKLKIPWTYNQIWLIGFVFSIISIIIYVIRKRFFGE